MENENKDDIITPKNNDDKGEETVEETTEKPAEQEAPKEEKPKETPEAKRARLKRQLKKVEKEMGIEEEKPSQPKPDEVEFSSGDKAQLKAYKDIEGAEELALAANWVKRTGDTIDTMLEDDIFLAKLDKIREAKKVKDATPSSGKRSSGSNIKAVEYWLTKPFHEVPKDMRAEVLNARLKNEEQKQMFGSG